MNKAAIFHRATDNWCYAIDEKRLHIRIATAVDDVDEVLLRCGDPHEWQRPEMELGRWTWKSSLLGLEREGNDGIRDFWSIVWEPPFRRARYAFFLRKNAHWYIYGEQGLFAVEADPRLSPIGAEGYWNTFTLPYINPIDRFEALSWVASTVWYQIFPERFRNGNPSIDPPDCLPWGHGSVTNRERYGGDLAGIIEKIEYLADLGVNGLYLTPIFAAPSAHKYDTEDYLRVDPAFGSGEDLRHLVKACHDRGMRILLDGVFNHCGRRFGPWLDVLDKGQASPYVGWFHIDSWPLFPNGRDTGDSRETGFETFAFTTNMPKLNTENPEMRDYLLSVAESYIRDFDIDGWRLDVANEIDHEFWRALRKRVKAVKADAFIVGEVWHDSMPWLRGDQFDAVMNYPYGNALVDFLLARDHLSDAHSLSKRLAALDFSYPLPVIRSTFNLLDSHDTERLPHKLGGDVALARMAWFLLFLLPGSPCIYYGSEVGLTGGGDPDNRRCMIWDENRQDAGQLTFMRALIAMRREKWREFAFGRRTFLQVPGEPGLVALMIGEGAGTMLALANRSDHAVDMQKLQDLPGSLLKSPRIAPKLLIDATKAKDCMEPLPAKGFRLCISPYACNDPQRDHREPGSGLHSE